MNPAHAEAFGLDWKDAMAEHADDWIGGYPDDGDDDDDIEGQLVITCLRCGWPWPGICDCKSEGVWDHA